MLLKILAVMITFVIASTLSVACQVPLVAHWSLIAVSVVSPNPVTIGSAIHVVTEIYENC